MPRKDDKEEKRRRRRKERDDSGSDSSDEEGSADSSGSDDRRRKHKRERERDKRRYDREDDRRRSPPRNRDRRDDRGRNDRQYDRRQDRRYDGRRDDRRRDSYRPRSPSLSPSPVRRKKPVVPVDDGKPKRVFDGFQWVECAAGAVGRVTHTNRRLHVGNLPLGSGLTEQQLTEFISTSMRQRGMIAADAPDPVTSVWLSPEGIYAFVEFQTIEAANDAMNLNGVMLLTSALRFARPNTYQPAVGTNISGILAMAQPNGAGAGGPSAVASMPQSMPQPPSGLAAISQLHSLTNSIGGNATAAPPVTPALLTSTVIACANMLTKDELMDEEEREGIKEDVGEECKKFGTVRMIKIPTIGNENCKVYIKFASTAEASTALKALSGRKFDGRTVLVTSIPEAHFDGIANDS